MELGGHARGRCAAGAADLVLGVLALHRRQLAGEQERGAAEVDCDRGGRRRGGFRLAQCEVGGREALDHRLDGEVVVTRLAPGGQLHQPFETQFRGGKPADVAEPAQDRLRQGLVKRQLARPGGAVTAQGDDPGVGLPVGVKRQGLEEVEAQGLGLEPALVDPGSRRVRRDSSKEEIAKDIPIERIDFKPRELIHGEPRDGSRRKPPRERLRPRGRGHAPRPPP